VRAFVALAALVTASIASVSPAAAQAWVPPAHTGEVTMVAQEIDHAGRMLDDGRREAIGKAINYAVDVEIDYALTDRLSISTSLPFIFSKYTDPNLPPAPLPFPPVDACRCWQAAFADFAGTARYNVVNVDRNFMVTPFVSVGVPSHAYDYSGEAVVGRRLKELRLGAEAGQRLDRWLAGLSVQAGYQYTIVGRVLDVPNNRSNGDVITALALPNGFSGRAIFAWQRTHGGLRFPSEVQVPEIPELLTEFHRMLRDNYLHLGGGVAYARGAWDVSASVLVTALGSNSHDIHVFSVTVGRSFEAGAH
jgi:hypothetical protein